MITATKLDTQAGAAGTFAVSVLQDAFKAALALPARVAATRTTLPATTMVLLRAGANGWLSLSATDLEQACVTQAGAKVDGEGAALAPARLLNDLVARLPEKERVDLTLEGNLLHVRSERIHAQLRTADPNDFPPIPTVGDDACTLTLPAEALGGALRRVTVAAAIEVSRPVLTGILFEVKDGALTLAAADGFRLAVQRVTLDGGAGEKGQWIVPASGMRNLLALMGDGDDPVTLAFGERVLEVAARGSSLTTQLIQGVFPNFRQLVPKTYNSRTVMQGTDLARALEVVLVAARDGAGTVRLVGMQDAATGIGTVTLSAQTAADAGAGGGTAALDSAMEGEPFKIAVNGRYLRDALAALGDTKVALETTSPSSPGVLRPVGDDSSTHVIMPVFVNW